MRELKPLIDIQRDYQTLLEHHRRDPDDETTWELYKQARSMLEREWLEHAIAGP